MSDIQYEPRIMVRDRRPLDKAWFVAETTTEIGGIYGTMEENELDYMLRGVAIVAMMFNPPGI
jgi:hypothetical protein